MYQIKLMGKRRLATFLISVILVSTIMSTVGQPIVVPVEGRDRVICCSGQSDSEAIIVDVMADKYIDLDGDGVDDVRVTTRRLIVEFTGVMDGTATGLQTIHQDLHTNRARATNIFTFYGRVGTSEPGAMTIIFTRTSDRSDPNLYKFDGTMVVIEGSGLGGLEGISGGGFSLGEGPAAGPFTITARYDFHFHRS